MPRICTMFSFAHLFSRFLLAFIELFLFLLTEEKSTMLLLYSYVENIAGCVKFGFLTVFMA